MANIVKRVVIEKLYDNYDYDITFDKNGVTLITGPNGYGKTTLLNIIKNALGLNFRYFYELLFSSITIYFDAKESAKLVIKRSLSKKNNPMADEADDYKISIAFYLNNNRKALERYSYDSYDYRRYREFYPSAYLRHGGITIEDEISDLPMRFRERYEYEVRQNFRNYRMFVNDKNCLFIKEQRIFSTKKGDDEGEDKYTITQLALDLKEKYADQKSHYTDEGQKIDSSFIQRLLSKEQTVYNEKEYLNRVNELNKYVDAYKQFGLISNLGFIGEYKEDFKTALTLYIEDMFKKIAVYDDFYRQLSLFNRFVNGKVLSNKKMILNEREGISFVSDSGRSVPLHKLSSGEQNLVILYYRLVFETEPNTLLLIDEPENSLHVEWLEKMLRDYLVMESDLKCQMIIATHSPIFIGDNWEIAYDLCGGSYQDRME